MRAGLHIVLLSLLSAFAAESLARDADLATLEDKARAGDVLAQVELASRYDFGTGIRRNPRRAERWYRAAAEAGNADAQNSLGSMLQERRKFDEARVWYEKAAAQAHAQGTNNLGYLFDLGLGTAQDRERGKELYLAAAKLGWGEAMWNLANMAALGQAGPVDWFATCVWTQRALDSKQGESGLLRKRAEDGMRELEGRLTPELFERCRAEAAQRL